MHQRTWTRPAVGTPLRAAVNLAWTGAVIIGAPVLLARRFGYPLPRELPDWGVVFSTPMQLVEPVVFFNAIACVGWITWIVIVGYVIIDITDLARGAGRRARRLGPASIVAAKLVASIVLLVGLMRPQPSGASTGRPVAIERVVRTPTPAPFNTVGIRAQAANTASAPLEPTGVAAMAAPTYVVQRGDSLWRIAEQLLGDGFRWKELYELNASVIANPDLICVGWTLVLPPDAATAAPIPNPEVTPSDVSDAVPIEGLPTAPAAPKVIPPPAGDPVVPEVVEGPATVPRVDALPAASSVPASTSPSVEPPSSARPPTSPVPSASEPRATSAADSEAVPRAEPPGTLPLLLRAQGFETRAEYEAWLGKSGGRPPEADSTPAALGRAAATTGIPVLFSACIIAAVEHRRRRVLRRRPPHGVMPPRDPELRSIERQLRAQPLADAASQIAWIDAILRYLSNVLHSSPPGAELLLVRAGHFGIELLWDCPPSVSCPEGFRCADGGQTWEYDCVGRDLDDFQVKFGDSEYYTQALVSLGESREGPVLVNLEAVSQVDISGDERAASQWLAAVAVELSALPWSQRVEVDMAQELTSPRRINTSIHLGDDEGAHPLVWRTDRTESAARWQLHFGGGDLQLCCEDLGLDIELRPVGIDHHTHERAAALLDDAASDPYDDDAEESTTARVRGEGLQDRTHGARKLTGVDVDDSSSRISGGNVVQIAQTREAESAPDADRSAIDPQSLGVGALLVVRVLGPVRTEGWSRVPKSPRTEDIVVYLAMRRPQMVTRERLIDALWNGKEVTNKLLYNYVGTLRKEAGDPSVVIAVDGKYVLSDAVRSDWECFTSIVSSVASASWSERRAGLSAALSLVYGRPFDDTDRHPWAATDGIICDIEVAICDAASDLATAALANEDYGMAIWAARRGLLACPWYLRLYEPILLAHTATEDTVAWEQLRREVVRVAGDDGLPPELETLLATRRVAAETSS